MQVTASRNWTKTYRGKSNRVHADLTACKWTMPFTLTDRVTLHLSNLDELGYSHSIEMTPEQAKALGEKLIALGTQGGR